MLKCLKPDPLYSHNPFAVRADPGRPVADPPFIFLKALHADLESARTVPAEGFFLFAAMAAVFTNSPASVPEFLLLHCYGAASSALSQTA